MSQNQNPSQSQRNEFGQKLAGYRETSRPNEIESIWYNEVVAMQSDLNHIVGLLKRSKEMGKQEIWETLIHKFKDLRAAKSSLNTIIQGIEWDMGGKENYMLHCGDG